MVLGRMTWPEAAVVRRDVVCVIPTGSMEQHGRHLPLLTDTLIVEAIAEAVEDAMSEDILLVPPIWLGASGHHMAFAGTLTASMEAYSLSLKSVLDSLVHHGFTKLFVLNGHGGNADLNRIVCRQLRESNRGVQIGTAGWYEFVPDSVWFEVMEGPIKSVKHACEAETSVMMYLHPEIVQMDKAKVDGLTQDSVVQGLVWMFDEQTEDGSFGHAPLATEAKGAWIYESAAYGVIDQMKAFAEGVTLVGPSVP